METSGYFQIENEGGGLLGEASVERSWGPGCDISYSGGPLDAGFQGVGVGAGDLLDLGVEVVDLIPFIVRIVNIFVQGDDVIRVRDQLKVCADTIPRLTRGPDDGEERDLDGA